MKIKIIISALLMQAAIACKKEPGPGGKAHISGTVYYASTAMAGASVYIWYGKTDVADCSSGYNMQISCNSKGEYEFHDMHKGDYFMYASCTDTGGIVRTGKLHVEIKSKSESVRADIQVQ